MRSKIMISLIALVCIVTCAFALVACNGKDDKPIDVKGKEFVFSDLFVDYSGNFPAEQKLTAEEIEVHKTNFDGKTIKFNEDGTFAWQYYSDVNGTYTQNKNSVKLVIGEEEVEVEVKGDSLTVIVKQEVEIDESNVATANIKLSYTLKKDSEGATDQVTQEQWSQIMQNSTNFTIGSHNMIQKVTDNAIYMEFGGEKEIYTQVGDKYVCYHYKSGAWAASYMPQSDYESFKARLDLFSFFKDDYAQFTYANGKYSASNLDKTETMNAICSSVEITFSNEKISAVDIVSIVEGEENPIEISNIGTTVIEIPTDVEIQENSNN